MSLIKVPILLANAVAMHKILTPPTPPASEEEKVEADSVETLFARIVRVGPAIAKNITWMGTLVEVAVILALNYPSDQTRRILDGLTGSPYFPPTTIYPSRSFLVGSALLLGGAYIRVAAFRALGRHFTFELSVQRSHALITAFPYNVVRHPSYTGGLLTALGADLAFGGRGGWLRACALPWANQAAAAPRAAALAAFVGIGLLQAALVTGVVARVPKEDAMMRDEFGHEWTTWAHNVPYKLFPFVY